MYEYEIINRNTQSEDFIYGRNFADACKRAGLDPEEWKVIYREYIDRLAALPGRPLRRL